MEDLIQQYKAGRRELRKLAKKLKEKKEQADDPVDLADIKNDLSLINGMIRDMTESISLMINPLHEMRGESREILMDPALITYNMEQMQGIDFETDPELNEEDQVRQKVKDELGDLIRERVDLLTNKQKSTLHRWIYDLMTISEIAAQDGVSRQSVWERIFGNKTHNGAINKLRYGR